MTTLCCSPSAATSAGSDHKQVQPAWHAGFLKLMPAIHRHARFSFRHLPAGAREEAIAEVLADAVLAYVRLESLGKTDLAYPTVLARYAIGRYRDGRRVGGQSNANDVMSGRCLRRNGVVVQPLHRLDHRTGTWREVLVEDRHSTPAQIAATRLDFADWLKTLSKRDRRLAEAFALGETTRRVARMFRISSARVSQLRRELCGNWHRFVGELVEVGTPAVATA
jgi:hypothetical protein